MTKLFNRSFATLVLATVLYFADTDLESGAVADAVQPTEPEAGTGSDSQPDAEKGTTTKRSTRKAGASGKGKGKGMPKATDADIPNVRRIQGKQMVRVVAMRRMKNGKLELIGSTPIRQTENLAGTLRFQFGRGYFGSKGTAPDGIKAKVQAAYEAGTLVRQLVDHVTGKVLLPVPAKGE